MVLFKSPHFVVPTPKCHPGKSPGAGSNRRPRPYQGRALPTELPGHTRQWSRTEPTLRHHSHGQIGAGNGTRTRDPELGRLALYQLSYSRKQKWWRGKDSNLRRHSRQIYSLLPLATREPLLFSCTSQLSGRLNPWVLRFLADQVLCQGAGDRI